MLYQQEHGACGTYMQEHDACGIGTIVNIDGRKDHKVLDDALHIVEKLEHRAGKDATGEVGDGVGILTQISHKFFKKAAQEAGIKLGGEGDYGIHKAGRRGRLRHRNVFPAAGDFEAHFCHAHVRGHCR